MLICTTLGLQEFVTVTIFMVVSCSLHDFIASFGTGIEDHSRAWSLRARIDDGCILGMQRVQWRGANGMGVPGTSSLPPGGWVGRLCVGV